jgi:hypothetical protein
LPFEATVDVPATAAAVREAIPWMEGDIDERADGCRVRLRSEVVDSLAATVAMLATRFDVALIEPADLRPRLAALADRLRAC